jgi:hypothetical protein
VADEVGQQGVDHDRSSKIGVGAVIAIAMAAPLP